MPKSPKPVGQPEPSESTQAAETPDRPVSGGSGSASAPRRTAPLAWIATVVFVFALGLRLLGIGWGLPHPERLFSYHPDEPIVLGFSQLVEPAKFDFDPGFYNYGTFYLTVLRVASDMVAVYGGGVDPQRPETVVAYTRACHLAGRVVNAVAGAGTAWIVLLILRRHVGLLAAGLGAAAVAVAPGFVVHSRFQTVDVFATFLLAVSALFALRLLPGRGEPDGYRPELTLRWVILSAAFAGLSAGTKYTGILALATLFVAIFVGRRSDLAKLGLAAVGTAVTAFVASTPGVVKNPAKFLEDFRYEMWHTSTGHGLVFAGLPNGFVWHLYNLTVGWGLILLIVGVAGIVAAARARQTWMIALAAFAAVYYVLIGRAEVLFLRYTFPLLPILAAGVAWVVDRGHGRGDAKGKAAVAVAILGIGGVLGGGLIGSVRYTADMVGIDPRDQAVEKLREMAGDDPSFTVGLVTDPWFYTPPLSPAINQTRGPFSRYVDAMESARPRMVRYAPEDPGQRFDWDVRLIDELSPSAIVFSSFEADDLVRIGRVGSRDPEHRVRTRQFNEFLERLKAEYVYVWGVAGTQTGIHDLEYIRPSIGIWRKKSDLNPAP
ncbi:MAG: glycosyltransferase family 39 protein [Fimbriimonadaceae bacterium]